MAFISGTLDNDTLLGTSSADVLLGLAGDDLLGGLGGSDVIDGGGGGDRLNGGNGNDLLFGNDGDDLLLGGNGNDLLAGDDGRDLLSGGSGNDTLRGGKDEDNLNGLSGNDILDGGDGIDILDGGEGRDLLLGGNGNDNLRGGNGRDTIDGGADNDAILGEGGSDTLYGGDGNDSIDGDAALRFFFLAANNTLIMLDPAQPNAPNLLPITGLPGDVSLRGIDRRPADNLLYGIGTDNRIYRLDYFTAAATAVSTLNLPFFNAGNHPAGVGFDFNPVPDRLRLVNTTGSNFRINVDTGAVADNSPDPGIQPDVPLFYVNGDVATGTPSIAAVAYTNNLPGVTTTMLFGIDSARNSLVRILSPNDGTVATIGHLGFDVQDDAAFDVLTSPTGDTNIAVLVSGGQIYQVDLTSGYATLLSTVGDGSQSFLGFAIAPIPDPARPGNDEIFGGNGNDILSGSLGNDTIRGEAGNDQLIGGPGNDVLVGGEGADAFLFQSIRPFQSEDFGRDRLLDFAPNTDKIILDQTAFGPLTPAQIAFVATDALAETSSGSIVYSQSSGRLFFNANGTTPGLGSGALFARLQTAPSLTANDFVIVP